MSERRHPGSRAQAPTARLPVLALVLLAACHGCAGDREAAGATIRAFLAAVQAEDLDGLYCLLAGAAPGPGKNADPSRRGEFAAWALSRYEAYLEGRDRGGVVFDDSGIALVKAFALGKGAFHEVQAIRSLDDTTLELESLVRFGYSSANYSRFSPGTTFYVAGTPMGAIHAVQVPFGASEESAEVLETVRLRWLLLRAPAGPDCPERWTVAAVEPVPGSETTSLVTWRF